MRRGRRLDRCAQAPTDHLQHHLNISTSQHLNISTSQHLNISTSSQPKLHRINHGRPQREPAADPGFWIARPDETTHHPRIASPVSALSSSAFCNLSQLMGLRIASSPRRRLVASSRLVSSRQSSLQVLPPRHFDSNHRSPTDSFVGSLVDSRIVCAVLDDVAGATLVDTTIVASIGVVPVVDRPTVAWVVGLGSLRLEGRLGLTSWGSWACWTSISSRRCASSPGDRAQQSESTVTDSQEMQMSPRPGRLTALLSHRKLIDQVGD
ncbi:hypothetical protein IWX90DRAFT_17806 [Phyllosticta citrichinensis]|uniref:Uncharacterized protein n=1 Tax=Phyllosticta citrichinensis TaxID=1130410 RepID=A0ABR1Y6Y6_9PEZI